MINHSRDSMISHNPIIKDPNIHIRNISNGYVISYANWNLIGNQEYAVKTFTELVDKLAHILEVVKEHDQITDFITSDLS